MNLFVSEIVTAPAHLPITVADADTGARRRTVEEIERYVSCGVADRLSDTSDSD